MSTVSLLPILCILCEAASDEINRVKSLGTLIDKSKDENANTESPAPILSTDLIAKAGQLKIFYNY